MRSPSLMVKARPLDGAPRLVAGTKFFSAQRLSRPSDSRACPSRGGGPRLQPAAAAGSLQLLSLEALDSDSGRLGPSVLLRCPAAASGLGFRRVRPEKWKRPGPGPTWRGGRVKDSWATDVVRNPWALESWLLLSDACFAMKARVPAS